MATPSRSSIIEQRRDQIFPVLEPVQVEAQQRESQIVRNRTICAVSYGLPLERGVPCVPDVATWS